jgi:WD40 repeat protein
MNRFLFPLAALIALAPVGTAPAADEGPLAPPELVFDAKEKVTRSAISPDGAFVAVGNSKAVTIYNVKTGTTAKFELTRTSGLDFTPSGSILACATLEQTKSDPLLVSYVLLLSSKSGKEAGRWPVWQNNERETINPVGVVKVSRNGKVLAVGSTNQTSTGGLITVYDIEKKTVIGQLETRIGGIVSLDMSEDGSVVYAGTPATANKKPDYDYKADFVIWKRDTKEPQYRQGHSGHVWAVAAIDKHKLIVTGGGTKPSARGESELIVWDQTNGKRQQTLAKDQACITSLAVNQDASLLASGDIAGTLLLWELPGMKLLDRVVTSKDSIVEAIRFAGDDVYVGTADGRFVKYRIQPREK